MNKTILTLVAATSLTLSARAALLLSDNFNSYPDGSLVGAPGSPWVHHSGATTGQVDVVSGKMNLTRAETEDVNATLNGGPYTTGSGVTLYASFIVNFSALPSVTGNFFAHLKDNTNGFRDRIWTSTANAATNKFRLGVGNGTSATAASGQIPTDLSLNTPYQVVTRYDVANGLSTIWLNPTDETDPGVTATDTPAPLDIFSFAFRQDTVMGILTVDDLRVGTSFADVVAVPEPSTFALFGLGAIGLLARRFRR